MQQALDFRTELIQNGGCAFEAEMTVYYGEEIYEFAVNCVYDAESGTKLELTKPETLTGIGAEISSDGVQMIYEDTVVGFPTLAEGRLSPMHLPHLLANAWYGEYISACGHENGFLRVTYLCGYGEEALTLDTWFDAEGIPVHGEAAYDGQTLLTADLDDFSLNRGYYENTQKNMGRGVSG